LQRLALTSQKKMLRSMGNFRIAKTVPHNEFQNLKKILSEDKFQFDDLGAKERKITDLDRNNRIKDHQIVKGPNLSSTCPDTIVGNSEIQILKI
jgi:hypothetical protein